MKSTLNAFWQARNEREKKVLIFCGIFLLLGLLYAYVWQPGEQAGMRLREILPQMRAENTRMHEQSHEIEVLRKNAFVQDKTANLKSEITASALRHKLQDRVSALTIDSADKAHLSMDAVSFDAWIRWLDALQRENHLRLETVHIQTLSDPGMVKVDATLAGSDTQ
ncbi:MAG: type II secretion system protein M [Betaproteobacteria bacterium]|nr:type II secretion system protein M [Betaproteobacteria bacterium]